jgi:S-adenosylmethionine:tRNA ribosyltransferase-isomerase
VTTAQGSGPRDVAAYDYVLPDHAIARAPAAQRDASRLLVVANASFDDRRFAELPALLQPGDVLAINETQVVRARLRARLETGGAVELLLLRPRARAGYDPLAREWLVLGRPARKLRAGTRLLVGEFGLSVVEVLADGPRVVRFDDGVDAGTLMERHGEVPLPPYVGAGDAARDARYQTVFARVPGSVAAPTASLHFTEAVFAALRSRGVVIAPLVLDVGMGTFRPMQGPTIDQHVMHAERYAIPVATAAALAAARAEGRRIVAAGTTVLRALEAAARADGTVQSGEAETELFVTPGFPFRVVDLLLTNFHLPRSTLLVLVAAFAGYPLVREAYRTAIERGYRFFSFGDAMLLARDPLSARPLV